MGENDLLAYTHKLVVLHDWLYRVVDTIRDPVPTSKLNCQKYRSLPSQVLNYNSDYVSSTLINEGKTFVSALFDYILIFIEKINQFMPRTKYRYARRKEVKDVPG